MLVSMTASCVGVWMCICMEICMCERVCVKTASKDVRVLVGGAEGKVVGQGSGKKSLSSKKAT